MTGTDRRKMPMVVLVALSLTVVALVASLIITVLTAPALVHRNPLGLFLFDVVPALLTLACLVGVTRAKGWARLVLAVLACVEAVFLIAALVQPGADVGTYSESVVLAPLRLLAVALLFTAPARRWFGRMERTTPAQWFPDPTGRHELRFWDGDRWTGRVANAGLVSEEPLAEDAGVAG